MTRHSAIVLIAVAALLLVGCGEDDGEDATAASPSVVAIENVDGTDVLTDAQGRTLYTAAVEKGGKILCVGGCTAFWAPVIASADDAERAASQLDADLSVLKRPEGSRQLTFDGLPLYTFTEEAAGELTGDGFTDDFEGTRFEWEAARADGSSGANPQDGGLGY
jgi:predicted lipoprotein with Yx(FWY)xxD motif